MNKILAEAKARNGELLYRVSWKSTGQKKYAPTWEPASNLKDAVDAIAKFKKKLVLKKKK